MLHHAAPPTRARDRCGGSLARARGVTGGHGLSRGDGPGRRGPVGAPYCPRPLPPWRRRGAGSGTRPRGPNACAEVRESGGCEPRGRPSVLRNTTRGHGLADRRNAGSNFTYCPAMIEGYYHRGAVGEVGSYGSAPHRAPAPRVFGAPPPAPRVPQRAYACLGGCPERPGAASRASPPPGILANLDGAPKRTEAHRPWPQGDATRRHTYPARARPVA